MRPRLRARPLVRRWRGWSPLAILVPLVYAVLGGFRDTGQIAADPVGAAGPVGVRELHARS